jgi:hypothetical protein
MSPRQASPNGPDPESPERDIVLLCNPRAGGRWKSLASILDSAESSHVRWIVTDSIEDIGPALAMLSDRTKLVCVYGGDGTIQAIMDQMYADRLDGPPMAFIGGGTMNVTARWCGFANKPARNFRDVVRSYRSGDLLTKEVPVLTVRQGVTRRHCFTFGLGPMVRVLAEYEEGGKGKAAALAIVGQALTAAWTNMPPKFRDILRPIEAEVFRNGERLPYDRWTALFCNSTGRLHIGVEPFVKMRTRETFYLGAYAVSKQEIAIWMPALMRGLLPVDPKSLIKPVSGWKAIAMSYVGQGSYPVDPRYINDLATEVEVRCEERVFTVDGEVVHGTGEPLRVRLGPTLRLAVSPTAALSKPVRLATGAKAPAEM